jgi:hypothetical protein
MWIFGQALIISIPLFDVEISCLQVRGQFLIFAREEFFPNTPSSLLLPKYSKAMAHHISTIPSLFVPKK